MQSPNQPHARADVPASRIPRSAYFALFVLVLTNTFNMLDRSVVSILAQSIKADLKLDDAQLGFLLGTAFAVFYSIVGIAMGRISDFIPRKKMLAFGLVLWSMMTALGGAATSFVSLSAARIGVGVGEAVANPCSHSLLADAFPARNRALALATYLTGTFLGSALAMIIGGLFVQQWPHFCSAIPIASACSLPGWKATLIAVGLPGVILAALVLMVREPERPPVRRDRGTFALILREIGSALPPFTLLVIHHLAGAVGIRRNLILAALLASGAALLAVLSGDTAQWIACALGAYSILTWGQVQSYGDKPLYRLTYGDRTFVLAIVSTSLVACITASFSVWAAPFAMRSFAVSPVKIGVGLGLVFVIGSIIGVIAGGWLTDRWKRRDLRAPLGMTMIALAGITPALIVLVLSKNITVFFCAFFVLSLFTSSWSGGIAALIQDLVLPRMRGAAAACYSLVAIVVASGIGPYWTGKVSQMTGSLATGILSILVLVPITFYLLYLAGRRLPAETLERRLSLAVAAGEPAS